MKPSVLVFSLYSFAVITLGGTILHFLYDLSGEALLLAPFAAVNESTFEHMKIFFWPALLYGAVQWCFFRERRDFPAILCIGILIGLLLIPVLFYTLSGAIGPLSGWANIAIFFFCAAVTATVQGLLLRRDQRQSPPFVLPLTVLALMGASFVLFTFLPPRIGLFLDPVSGGYGI